MKMRLPVSVTWSLTLALLLGQAWAMPSPTEQIKGTIDSVLAVLRNPDMAVNAKKQEVRNIIGARFDYRAMSQRTLAQNWRKATDAEKDQFVSLYTKLLQDTYLVLVEEYTNESVEYRNEKIHKEKYAQVDTVIVAPDKEIPVIYKARLKDDGWYVYDVVIEGVSMISNYRSSYQEIAKREGIDGLIAKLEEKTACVDC